MKIRGITKTISSYRVYFYDGKLLVIYFDPETFSGHSIWCDYFGVHDVTFEEAATEGKLINNNEEFIDWQHLPNVVQAQIEKMIYLNNGQ